MGDPRRVYFVATVSQVPYAVRDAETGELLGYADEPEDANGVGYMTCGPRMFNLGKPEIVAVVGRDESAWE